MKKAAKILGGVIGVVVLAVVGLLVWINTNYDHDYSDVALPEIKASDDPAVIAQGEYLVHTVGHCSACHGPAEKAAKYQLGERHELQGGHAIVAGPFGTFRPSNLTSDPETGLGKLSDGQIARAVRHGVARDGRFAPFMSFAVGNMSDEDLTAIVSYLRTVPAIRNDAGRDEFGIIAKGLATFTNFGPRREPVPKHVPQGGVSVERGEYLANGPGLCYGCHSTMDPSEGMKIVGARFQGSAQPEPDPTAPDSVFTAPNLTPDPKTGVMATWTEDVFVDRFKAGRVYPGSKMPWDNFAQMSEEDLRSIYRYLKSLQPVENFTGPSYRKADWAPPEKA